jgi:hypothetical protein
MELPSGFPIRQDISVVARNGLLRESSLHFFRGIENGSKGEGYFCSPHLISP